MLYRNGTFGSYYEERIEAEFTELGAQPLPAGYPKIAAKLPNGRYMSGHKAVAYVNGETVAERMREHNKLVDGRPYHVVFVDFFKRVVTKREVKK